MRQVLSNDFTLNNSEQATGKIPVYEVYDSCYRGCDNVNSQIAGKLWPHKYGGRGVLGARGTQHNFALMMTCINTFNAYKAVRRARTIQTSRQTVRQPLTRPLYVHAL